MVRTVEDAMYRMERASLSPSTLHRLSILSVKFRETLTHIYIYNIEAFSRILGIKPAFMRPPYGDYNDNIREIAHARNQSCASISLFVSPSLTLFLVFSLRVYSFAY
jgi:hypothetical protein